MYVLDLITDPRPELWGLALQTIGNSMDRLRHNYPLINFAEFLSFPAVVENNEIICFSGLQYDVTKWGEGIGRISSRMWIHPHYRVTGKFTGGEKFLNTTYCLPIQHACALNHNLNVVFISRERNRRGFEQYLKLIKVNLGSDFTLLPNQYNVGGGIEHPDLIQHVGIHNLTPYGSETWAKNMSKYASH